MQQSVYDDLKRSAIPQEVVDRHQILYLSSSQVARKTGMEVGHGYAIPYFDLEGNLTDEARIRLLNPKENGPKYVANSLQHHIYFPLNWDIDDTLLITEGEKKSLSAVVHGFSCIGIAGVDMWHAPEATGTKRTPDKPLHRELKAAINSRKWREIIVIADSDAAENSRVSKAMTTLARAIRMQCRVQAKYMAMPTSADGGKCGIDDFLTTNTPDALREILESAQTPLNGYRYVIPYREAMGHTLHVFIPYYYGDEPIYPPIVEERIKIEKDKKDDKEKTEGEENAVEAPNAGKIVVYKAVVPTPALWYKETLVIFQVKDSRAVEENFDYPVREVDIVEGMTDSRRHTEFAMPDEKVADFVRNCGFGTKFSPVSQDILAAQKRYCPNTSYGVMSTGWVHLRNHGYYILPGLTVKSCKEAPDCTYYQPGASNNENFSNSTNLRDALNFARTLLLGSSGLCALAGFALGGALITPLQQAGANPEPSIIHLGGGSGRGKTSALRFVAGLAGSPTPPRSAGSLIKTWRATENGLEGPLERANDSFLMLDELGQASENTDWNALLYLTANGTGKARMTRNISARRNLRWTCNILSTGEKSILAQIKTSIPPEGLVFRVIDYEYDSDLFYDKTDLWSFSDSLKIEERIDSALNLIGTHHGWVFRKYIEAYMTPEKQALINDLYFNTLATMREALSGDETSAYTRRAKTIALIIASASLIDIVLHGDGQIAQNAALFARSQFWPAGIGENITKSESTLLGEEVLSYLSTLPVSELNSGKFQGIFLKDGHLCVGSAGIHYLAKILQMDKSRILQGLREGFDNRPVWLQGVAKTARVWISNEKIFSIDSPQGGQA